MPSTIIGVWHPAIFKPAARWRWWWGLHIPRSAIIGDGAADDAPQKTGCNTAGDHRARIVMMMPARRITIRRRWRRRSAAIVAIRSIIILSRSGLNAGKQRAGSQHRGEDRKQNFLHGRNLQVSWHRTLPPNARSICHSSAEHAMNAQPIRKDWIARKQNQFMAILLSKRTDPRRNDLSRQITLS